MFVDMENPLGFGDYGQVYKGMLQVNKDTSIPVAVKTVNPCKTDAICFKALLTELKIMTFIGLHQHVIRCLGASTEGIRESMLTRD